MVKTYSMELAGRTLTIESGRIAELANGSVMVKYGDTVVMVNFSTISRLRRKTILSRKNTRKLYKKRRKT